MSADTDNRITLGGRTFVEVTDGTVEHDLKVGALVARSGLEKVERLEGETARQLAGRLLDACLASETLLDLLSCLLIPEDLLGDPEAGGTRDPGQAWSPAVASETRAHLAALRGEENKIAIRALTLRLLVYFFERGIASIVTLPTSSSGGGPETQNLRPATPSGSGIGPASYPSLPAATLTAPGPSSGGPSGRPS